MNLVLISSVINITKNKFSNGASRSVFGVEDRFNQTIQTIDSCKKLKNVSVVLAEATEIPKDFESILKSKVDQFIQIKDDKTTSEFKVVTEASLLRSAIDSIDLSKYDNIFKLSGRYYLNDNFDYSIFDNNETCFFMPAPPLGMASTILYKINSKHYELFLETLDHCRSLNSAKFIEAEFYDKFEHVFSRLPYLRISGLVSDNGQFISY